MSCKAASFALIVRGCLLRSAHFRQLLDRPFQLIGLKPDRSGLALVQHLAIAAVQLQPVGPACVIFSRGAVQTADDRRCCEPPMVLPRASNTPALRNTPQP